MILNRRKKRVQTMVALRQRDFVVVLQDVHDPHNAAAVLRTCDAFGIPKVYFVFEREKPYNPKKVVSSSSASANKWLDLGLSYSTPRLLRKLKKSGYTIFATTLDKNSSSIFQQDFLQKKIALWFGNEHRGLSASAIAGSDVKLYIPMRGMVQSLNISVTAAICVFEVTRQRAFSNKKFTLTPIQKRQLSTKLSRYTA